MCNEMMSERLYNIIPDAYILILSRILSITHGLSVNLQAEKTETYR